MPSSYQPCILGCYSLVVGVRQSISMLQSRLDYSLAPRCWSCLGSRPGPSFKFAPQALPLPKLFLWCTSFICYLCIARKTLHQKLPSFYLLPVTVFQVTIAPTLHFLFTSHLEATKRILNLKGLPTTNGCMKSSSCIGFRWCCNTEAF